MGKRIISQARGHGSLSYQAKKRAFIYKVKYPMHSGEAEIINIIHSTAHSAPLMKVKAGSELFYNPAFNTAFVGQKISIGSGNVSPGNILMLKNMTEGTEIYNIENNPGDGER